VDEITLGAGVDELLILLCRAFVDPGDPVVVNLGGYPTFEFGVHGAGGRFVRIPYREDAPDLDGLAEAVAESNARIVYLANPDNPSGHLHSAADVQAFRARLPEGCLLILDEAYADFVTLPELPVFDRADPGIVRLQTFSKAHGMAGMRVGYAVGHPHFGKALDKVRPHFGVNALAQVAALASLSDPAHLADVVAATTFGRMELMAIARRCGLAARPSRTNFVLFDAGTRAEADALLDKMLRAGVFLRKPGQAPLDRFIRVTVGTDKDHHEFERILHRELKSSPNSSL
jgi:histidinol-phosphate aminotransferase